MKSWKFRLSVVAIFLLGAVLGAVATGLYFRYGTHSFEFNRPEQAVRHIMGRLDRELGLSEEQRQAIQPIVLDGFMKMRALRARLTPEVEALVTETSRRVKEHLNPDQQRRLDEHYTEVMRRWRVYAGTKPATSAPAAPGADTAGPAPATPSGGPRSK